MVSQRCKLPLHRQHSSRLLVEQRCPNRLQRQMLRKLQANLMEPETFLARWDITHRDLADICFVSEATVSKWFLKTFNGTRPKIHHKVLMAITNKLWTDLLDRQENT